MLSTKGGVGKSTISLLLSNALAEKGFKVLLIDRDPLGWSSSIAGIKDIGLVQTIISKDNKKIRERYYIDRKVNNGKLGILKLFGQGPHYISDLKSYTEKDVREFEEKYVEILNQGFNYYVVDNPSMVTWNSEEVMLELPIFEKYVNAKIGRIYVTDYSEVTLSSIRKYINILEGDKAKRGEYLGIVMNMVPPFPVDIERARQMLKDFNGMKIIIPFVEKLFSLRSIADLKVPAEIREIIDYISTKPYPPPPII
ncbi:tyrosine-protein kinase family protein [Candidatus Acidianus copahuensis]|uniref:tyrosine-protein kinase family protein n=1 Tax=Candidatus Acidianus copahuensis TaxID=1160895 RepID=UPI00064FF57F|nr:ParA family protein [Candidatus Acidianus copahuensis]